jgi:hypothetical protein
MRRNSERRHLDTPEEKATEQTVFSDYRETDRNVDALLNELADRVANVVLKTLVPRVEASLNVKPRWLSIESAGAYIDKNYDGMRHTLRIYQSEIPVVTLGGVKRIDIQDIDRLCMNLKGR